ncbi:MAG: hypothetical protein Q4B81_06845 [Moraxella sp.]|nr:hypothetical protein [Moraxella sp.]
MLIDIAVLPSTLQQQILTIKEGETVQFAYNGELFGRFIQEKEVYSKPHDSLMATAGLWRNHGIDGLEYQEHLRNEWVRGWEK